MNSPVRLSDTSVSDTSDATEEALERESSHAAPQNGSHVVLDEQEWHLPLAWLDKHLPQSTVAIVTAVAAGKWMEALLRVKVPRKFSRWTKPVL